MLLCHNVEFATGRISKRVMSSRCERPAHLFSVGFVKKLHAMDLAWTLVKLYSVNLHDSILKFLAFKTCKFPTMPSHFHFAATAVFTPQKTRKCAIENETNDGRHDDQI